jgi:hypothetical protein
MSTLAQNQKSFGSFLQKRTSFLAFYRIDLRRFSSWQTEALTVMLQAMETMNADTGQSPRSETDADLQSRIAREAAGIAEARADVAAGRLVDAALVRAWVDSLHTENTLPVPTSIR